MMKNSRYKAVYLQPSGFSFIKALPIGNFIFENHKNASFTTLPRECGIFFGEEFSDITVIVNYGTPTLVPKELFSQPAVQFLRPQVKVNDSDEVVTEEWGDYIAVYSVPAHRATVIRQLNVPFRFRHVALSLVRYLSLNYTDSSCRMALFFQGNTAQCALMEGSKLLFLNSLSFSNAEELVYHLAHLLQMQEVAPNECRILFSGNLPDSKKTFDFVSQYFPDLDWAGNYLNITIQTPADKSVTAAEVLHLLPF